ncbi:hypothetical protein EDD85DRAFT_1022702 [Armillaria nabsnona]|nr:hypothetical protein EDD85DRAFT_1022702 [Armillaria nabsnona]
MDRQLTWEDFLDIRFNHHMDLEEDSPTSSTAPYSSITSPPAERYLRQSGPNATIVPRILDSFRFFLEEKGILDQPLPADLVNALGRFQWELSRTTISIETTVAFVQSSVFPIITRAVEELADQAFTVTQHAPLRQYTQRGGINWKTEAVTATKTPVKSTTMQAKQPRVMFHHATDMQNEYEYEPHIAQYNAKAICSKAWLQLSTCNPASQYGVLFSGLSAVILGRCTCRRILCDGTLNFSSHAYMH